MTAIKTKLPDSPGDSRQRADLTASGTEKAMCAAVRSDRKCRNDGPHPLSYSASRQLRVPRDATVIRPGRNSWQLSNSRTEAGFGVHMSESDFQAPKRLPDSALREDRGFCVPWTSNASVEAVKARKDARILG